MLNLIKRKENELQPRMRKIAPTKWNFWSLVISFPRKQWQSRAAGSVQRPAPDSGIRLGGLGWDGKRQDVREDAHRK